MAKEAPEKTGLATGKNSGHVRYCHSLTSWRISAPAHDAALPAQLADDGP